MSKITSLYQLLTYIQSWSELGANFAVPVEDVCEYFGIDLDAQLLKLSGDETMLEGFYTTSPRYGSLQRLALTQFTKWLLSLMPDEIAVPKRDEFKIFWKEYATAIAEGRINPLNGKPENVGL